MPSAASKSSPLRFLADADLHAREAARSIKQARQRLGDVGLEQVLEGLERDQRHHRKVLERVSQLHRRRKLEAERA
jgi:hypothetical protein